MADYGDVAIQRLTTRGADPALRNDTLKYDINVRQGGPKFLRHYLATIDDPEYRNTTIKKYFPEAVQIPDYENNWIIKNPDYDPKDASNSDNRPLLLWDPTGFEMGDVAEGAASAPAMIGGTIGAIAAAPGIWTSALGGGVAAEMSDQLYKGILDGAVGMWNGEAADRGTYSEQARRAAMDVAIDTLAGGAADKAIPFVKAGSQYAFKALVRSRLAMGSREYNEARQMFHGAREGAGDYPVEQVQVLDSADVIPGSETVEDHGHYQIKRYKVDLGTTKDGEPNIGEVKEIIEDVSRRNYNKVQGRGEDDDEWTRYAKKKYDEYLNKYHTGGENEYTIINLRNPKSYAEVAREGIAAAEGRRMSTAPDYDLANAFSATGAPGMRETRERLQNPISTQIGEPENRGVKLPTLGVATGDPLLLNLEQRLAQFPGAKPLMLESVQDFVDSFARELDSLSYNLNRARQGRPDINTDPAGSGTVQEMLTPQQIENLTPAQRDRAQRLAAQQSDDVVNPDTLTENFIPTDRTDEFGNVETDLELTADLLTPEQYAQRELRRADRSRGIKWNDSGLRMMEDQGVHRDEVFLGGEDLATARNRTFNELLRRGGRHPSDIEGMSPVEAEFQKIFGDLSESGVPAPGPEAGHIGRIAIEGTTARMNRIENISERLYDRATKLFENDPTAVSEMPNTMAYMREIRDEMREDTTNVELGSLAKGRSKANQRLDQIMKDWEKTARAAHGTQIVDVGGGQTEEILAGPGQFHVNAIRKLRTDIRNEMKTNDFGQFVPASLQDRKLLGLYKALTKDRNDALSNAQMVDNQSGLNAKEALERADRYYREHMRVADFVDELQKGDNELHAFKYAMQGSDRSGQRLRQLRANMPTGHWDAFRSSILMQMGMRKPSGSSLEDFSTRTFITNWRSMANTSKDVLFGKDTGRGYRADMDALVQLARKVGDMDSYINFSRTGDMEAFGILIAPLVSGVTNVASGAPVKSVAAGIGSTVGLGLAAQSGARLMTDPDFIKWIVGAGKRPLGNIKRGKGPRGTTLKGHLGRLLSISQSNPELQAPVLEYINSVKQFLADATGELMDMDAQAMPSQRITDPAEAAAVLKGMTPQERKRIIGAHGNEQVRKLFGSPMVPDLDTLEPWSNQ